MPWQNIVFDLDGTLTDSREGIERSLRYALSELGCPSLGQTDLGWAIGPPIDRIMTRLLGPVSDSRITEAVSVFRSRYYKTGYLESQVYPGVATALSNLESQGKNLFVCTSKRTFLARRVLEHFRLATFFKNVYGSQSGFEDKSEMLGDVLDREGLDPEVTVMVGDRKYDMHAAAANGLAGIGVAYGYGSREELTEAGAGIICRSPEELVDVLISPRT